MKYHEYNEKHIDLKNLENTFISEEIYTKIHESTVIFCHDVFIRCTYQDVKGLLLVKRLREPAKDLYWPIGGRVLRGLPTEDSLIKKAKNECNVTLKNIEYLGSARTFFDTEPFGHNHGTDTFNVIYIADGVGEITLNNLHTSPIIVNKETYISIKATLPLYVQNFIHIIDSENLWESKES